MNTRNLTFDEAVDSLLLNPRQPLAAVPDECREAQEALRKQSRPLAFPPGSLILPLQPERRDMTATGGTTLQQGGMTIGTDIPEIGPALRAAMVTARLGARVFTNLQHNVDLPHGTGAVTAEWLAENASTTPTSEELAALSLRAHRINAKVPVSAQLLREGGPIFYNWLIGELTALLATELDRVAIAGTGQNSEPTGILYTQGIGSVVGGTNGAAPDLQDLADLEHAVTDADAHTALGWIVSPKVRRKLRLTGSNGTGSAMLWPLDSADRLLGHPAGVTTASPDDLDKGSSTDVCSAIIFGSFTELILGFWGPGIAIQIDPYTKDTEGLVYLTASGYVDSGVRTPQAFAAMKDALTA